ncbi:Crp/Fnr family transcriptional regulator [Conexibacter sp. JD483]|uniref:Crp/Fnr family transcriptional regulator n=1 Tax=unclassified Conexibacter TaxID=2627773 RepID=UPI0027293116|nr:MULTISPECIES: Crp/Fnr family transcriptional regulator [unclassified Conexibacter]MDO8188611.1 Crp/Fnr family transcriptional regulator [Conexibacter sp. CPCC 205706]MDO8201501.1 Crp/Fnr family transcriptional regulator [Conexibacter sp. CPCC 205762]MDR9370868.1 Crp/Fnr family transcriptional regulator [Conexibacter sp. JD483]
MRTVSLLDVDPDLGELMTAGEREEARRLMRARVVQLARGVATEAVYDSGASALHGLLLLDGLVSRTIALTDATAVELLGRGDLIEPSADALGSRLVPIDVSWAVLEPAEAVIVDDDLLYDARRWPQLVAALFERLASQATRLATRCAISQLPRAEERVRMLLWFLAERWGRIGRDGIVLPLRLTHEMLGQMLGTQRPTVSLALRQLERDGAARRRIDGAWLLPLPREEIGRLVPHPSGGIRRLAAQEAGGGSDADLVAAVGAAPTSRSAQLANEQLQMRIERLEAIHAREQKRIDADEP